MNTYYKLIMGSNIIKRSIPQSPTVQISRRAAAIATAWAIYWGMRDGLHFSVTTRKNIKYTRKTYEIKMLSLERGGEGGETKKEEEIDKYLYSMP